MKEVKTMGKAMGNFTELDAYLFGQGTHYDIYKKLGAHLSVDGKKKGCLLYTSKKQPDYFRMSMTFLQERSRNYPKRITALIR